MNIKEKFIKKLVDVLNEFNTNNIKYDNKNINICNQI